MRMLFIVACSAILLAGWSSLSADATGKVPRDGKEYGQYTKFRFPCDVPKSTFPAPPWIWGSTVYDETSIIASVFDLNKKKYVWECGVIFNSVHASLLPGEHQPVYFADRPGRFRYEISKFRSQTVVDQHWGCGEETPCTLDGALSNGPDHGSSLVKKGRFEVNDGLLKSRTTCGTYRGGIGAMGALAGPANAPDACGIPHGTIRRTFESCRAYEEEIRAHTNIVPTAFAVIATANYPVAKRVDETIHVTVRYGISPKSYILLPEYSWPDMTDAEKVAMQEMVRKLGVHEHGHLAVAREVIKDHGTDKFTAAKLAQAQAESDRRRKRLVEKINAEQKKYDALTAHGGRQSAGPSGGYPGGEDVTFRCPVG